MALIVTDALKFRESENDQFRRLSLSANFNMPVPVSQGGTGADNAADARTNLGVPSLLDVYPVGSIYMSVNSTSPATIFGGTWERIQDRFLLAAGSTYAAGSTGGEATHTLTVNEIPSHTHSISPAGGHGETGNFGITQLNMIWADQTSGSAGGGQAHNNMPPYLAVYMWKRTA